MEGRIGRHKESGRAIYEVRKVGGRLFGKKQYEVTVLSNGEFSGYGSITTPETAWTKMGARANAKKTVLDMTNTDRFTRLREQIRPRS